MSSSKLRLDQWLVEKGMAVSRTKAKDLVEAGKILRDKNGQQEILKKASTEYFLDENIFLREGAEEPFVSRAGEKLAGAFQVSGINPKSFRVLDVGQSTGGFTDCVLQLGAASVVGVDVGHDQLHPQIRKDPRVKFFEGVNARELQKHPEICEIFSREKPDLIVMDLSFISLELVIPALDAVAQAGTQILALVKPQFEVGPEGLGKGGIVRDALLYPEVERKIKRALESHHWEILQYFQSSLAGKDGNQEFFVHGIKK